MHIFCGNNFFPKSQKGNEIWTFLKMSKNENPKKVLKTPHFFTFSPYRSQLFFLYENFVTLFFS